MNGRKELCETSTTADPAMKPEESCRLLHPSNIFLTVSVQINFRPTEQLFDKNSPSTDSRHSCRSVRYTAKM